jgi:hypothetical protein
MENKPPTRPSRRPTVAPLEKTVSRKAGHIPAAGEEGEAHVPEGEGQQQQQKIADQQQKQLKAANQKINDAKKVRPREDSEARKKHRRAHEEAAEREKQQQPSSSGGEGTKAGLLAHNAAFQKFQNSPNLGEIVAGKSAPKTGESFATLLPTMRAHPDLPEPDMRPPTFLSLLEAMSDIYMRTRGRMSNKTKELLKSVALEDLLGMLVKLFENDQLARHPEARLQHKIWSKLKDEPGPLLLGINDKRLTEPWRLFLDRWEIWVPDDDEDETGVELFWEGEAEDDDGETIELLQSLTFQRGELTLYAKMGSLEDKITFDGEAFYRLKTNLRGGTRAE